MIGFYVNCNSLSEFASILMKFGEIYNVPVAAIYPKDLLDHYYGKPMYGYIWDQGEALRCEIPFPTVIDVGGSVFKRSHNEELAEWVRSNALILRQKSLPKSQLWQAMISGDLSGYAIPTWQENSFELVEKRVQLLHTVFLKPSEGRKGNGTMILCQDAKGSIVSSDRTGEHLFTKEYFDAYIQEIESNNLGHAVLLQPFLDFKLDDQHAVDFRLLRHRGETGEWEEVATYARIGGSALVSNLAQGGYVGDPKEVLQSIAGDKTESLYDEIIYLGQAIPKLIQKYRGNSAFCLGIDVAVDRQSLRPYVLEANTYPGTKYHLYQLAEKRVMFYRHILQKI